MKRYEIEQQVAATTGDDLSTIRRLGFSCLTLNVIEERDEPLVVDWDELAASR